LVDPGDAVAGPKADASLVADRGKAESMTTHTPIKQIRDAWDAVATGFDEFVTPQTLGLGEEVVGRLGLGPGMRFLDVGTGSGALAIPAARLGARVVAVDIAPVMIERLHARADREGLPDLEGRVMDGHALDLEDDTFDVSASQNGVSLFPDLAGGLAELVRVTKPGGRVLIVVFGPLKKVEFFGFFMGALQAAVPGFTPPPTDPPSLPFQVADPDVLRRRLTEAGLTGVTVEAVIWDMRFESATHFWDWFISSNPIAVQLTADLTAEQTADVRQVLDGMFRERSGGMPGVILHTGVNVGVGTK
jgi:ubiquinone/menaquinone biosynthesis C-methylase UbiE